METKELAEDEVGARRPLKIPEEFGASPPAGRGGGAGNFDAGKVLHGRDTEIFFLYLFLLIRGMMEQLLCWVRGGPGRG